MVDLRSNGSATFAGEVGAPSVKAQPAGVNSYSLMDGTGIFQTNTSGSTSISLTANGNATFDGNGYFKGSSLALSRLGTANNGVFMEAGDLGSGNRPKIEIKGASSSGLSNTAFATYYNNGANESHRIEYDGTTLIGGTLPSAPNIRLSADGNASLSLIHI